jgi:hypothetical protein
MTLIITRTSSRYALMVSDLKVTINGADFDSDANKNIVFKAKNAVITIGYTGSAFIGPIPTDQWIAETLTGLTFPEGKRGRGTVPSFWMEEYEDQELGLCVRNLRDRLNEVRQFILAQYRRDWTARSFDLVITGFEWNHSKVRPYIAALSKPSNSDTFELSDSVHHWYLRPGRCFPVRMCAAPSLNITQDELKRIDNRLKSVWGDGDGTPVEVADHAENILVEVIHEISTRLNVVGADTMSILIPPLEGDDPTIRIRYIPAGRDQGVLITKKARTPVKVAFSPWIVCPGFIQSPTIFTNLQVESKLGPYRVVMDAPSIDGKLGAMSSQKRPTIEG